MSKRARLVNRRASENLTFECNGLHYVCTFSRLPNGELGELFINNAKQGSQSDNNARDAAITCSLALQFGAPLDVIRHALLRDSTGRASTPLGEALDRIAALSNNKRGKT